MDVMAVDLYNGAITEKVACSLTSSMGAANHSGPKLLILNDQGGGVLHASDDGAVDCLRAEMHGHPPVVCFEPGVQQRLGRKFGIDVCSTLRAEMGDNQPAVCYAIDHVVTTGGNCTAQGPCYYKDICPTEKASGVHAICYVKEK